MADSIANFTFVRLDAPPELVQAKLAASTRPGTSGVTLHNLGTWAEPFQVNSLAVAQDLTSAINLYVGYLQLVAQAAVQVTWASHNYALVGHRFYVVNVAQPRHRRLLYGVGPGGLYYAETEALWTLQPIYLG